MCTCNTEDREGHDKAVLRSEGGATVAAEPESVSDQEDQAQPERTILCAACAASITSLDHRMAVQGTHEHRFMNPAGALFHIGCFAHAIGCTIVGPDSLEYPWFAGFAWRFAMCGSCGQHLGWHFRITRKGNEGDAGFFGLVLDRLVQPQSV
jgi:hypothetical protein